MSDKIKVLLIKPMKPPEVTEIDDTLETMQKAVGGDIEAVYPFEEPVALVCCDEGKLMGMPLNCSLRDESGKSYDIIAGDFFICDASGSSFGSLSDKQLKEFGTRFRCPERFIRTPEGIESVTLIPPARHNNDAR